MDFDFGLLGRAVKADREAAGLTQLDLANAAGVSEGTIKNIERGEYRRWPTSLPAVEQALGKEAGWARRLATHKDAPSAPPAGNGGAASPATITGSLPAGVRLALSEGETLGADVIHLEMPVGTLKIIVVAQASDFQTDDEIAALRVQMDEWVRLQQEIRTLTSRHSDTKNP